MRTDIFGLNGYAGCVDEQGYVYRVSRNQALSNDACIGKIDSNGNVYRQSKHDLTSNSNIVGTWSKDGSIYVVGDSMLRGSNYIGAYDSRGYVYLNAKNEVNSSDNQAGFVQGNIPYGAAALLLLLKPAYEESSQPSRRRNSKGNKSRGQQRRVNQEGSRNRSNNKNQNNKGTNAANLKYPKETYLAYGIGIAILIFVGYCLAKIAKAILYAATSVSFIATVIFLVFGWKLQKQVILGRRNKRLSDNDKRIIWQWVILCAVIVAMIGAVQDVINSSYIGSNIIWIIIGLSVYYLFFSAQYKLGKFDVSPIEFVTGKKEFSNQGQDRNVKSKQTRKPKGNNKSQGKSNQDYILLQCNECGQKSRIPANRGMLLVTCPRCGNTCEVES